MVKTCAKARTTKAKVRTQLVKQRANWATRTAASRAAVKEAQRKSDVSANNYRISGTCKTVYRKGFHSFCLVRAYYENKALFSREPRWVRKALKHKFLFDLDGRAKTISDAMKHYVSCINPLASQWLQRRRMLSFIAYKLKPTFHLSLTHVD